MQDNDKFNFKAVSYALNRDFKLLRKSRYVGPCLVGGYLRVTNRQLDLPVDLETSATHANELNTFGMTNIIYRDFLCRANRAGVVNL